MSKAASTNKVKHAKRVIDVLTYFANHRGEARVIDFAREFGWPQSSTSELLSMLIEEGLLYKNPRSRGYRPSIRVGALGYACRVEPASDRLFECMEALARPPYLGVGLFSMRGLEIQMLHWSRTAGRARFNPPERQLLSASSLGHLLMSTLDPLGVRRTLWGIRAAAGADEPVDARSIEQQVAALQHRTCVTGPSGLAPDVHVTAFLLCTDIAKQVLTLGVFHSEDADVEDLAAEVRDSLDLALPRDEAVRAVRCAGQIVALDHTRGDHPR